MPTSEEYEAEALREVLELQAALQRIRSAQAVGAPARKEDLDLIRPLSEYRGGNLDRLWASEEY